jgi:hypothetical protein
MDRLLGCGIGEKKRAAKFVGRFAAMDGSGKAEDKAACYEAGSWNGFSIGYARDTRCSTALPGPPEAFDNCSEAYAGL